MAYPVAIALIGLGAELHRSEPWIFFGLVLGAGLVGAGRILLVRSFEDLYARSPRWWRAGFLGGGLATGALFGGLVWQLVQQGLTLGSVFAVAATLGVSAMVIVMYAHDLRVVWSYILVLEVPPTLALAQAAGSHPEAAWLAGGNTVAALYLLWVAWQQHHERWEELEERHALQRRAVELESEHAQVERIRRELESVVAERTRELERTSRDYQQIFENAHDPIIVFRPEDERVLNVNRRACEVYGFTRDEFLGISLASISLDVARGQEQIRDTLEAGVYHNFESVQFRKDGSRMFLEINAAAIEYGGLPAVISINRDVTERRRAEALRLAKEAAERDVRAKAQFLANMSHEIRTPMAGVMGLADLLLATPLDERQSEYTRLILSSAGSLLRVIDDILDFSKIDAGKITVEEAPFDLRATLAEVGAVLRLRAVAKGIALDVEMAEDLPRWVSGDAARLRQVLMNLIGNAVKFTESGAVSVFAGREAGGFIELRVHDTGIGLTEEAQARLFEPFSQGDSSTSRRFGGTGLGLAITKGIVEAMGGRLDFRSAVGAGSTFAVELPLPPCSPPPEVQASEGRDLLEARVLVVEDEPINRRVITEHLLILGCRVTAVAGGLEALEALAHAEHDLVLMDCQMPHLDGYETTERIRRLPGRAGQLPIVALTAHALQEDLDRCLAVGMNDHITKPFRRDVLRGKLERWLGAAAPAPPAPCQEAIDPRQLDSLREMGQLSGPGFLTGLVEQFAAKPYIRDLHQALERGDRAALQVLVHSLKGTSALLGARSLPRLCEELMRTCHSATHEECLLQVGLIEAEHRRFVEGLAGYAQSEVLQRVPPGGTHARA